jgi:hypothetical protein
MPRRWGKQQMARRRGLRQAFRRAAKRGMLDAEFAQGLVAADIGFSAEDVAKLLAESQAARPLAHVKPDGV